MFRDSQDVVALAKDGVTYDVIGDINSEGPWNVGSTSGGTKDHTLVRSIKSAVTTTTWTDAGNILQHECKKQMRMGTGVLYTTEKRCSARTPTLA